MASALIATKPLATWHVLLSSSAALTEIDMSKELNWENVCEDSCSSTGKLKIDGGFLYRVRDGSHGGFSLCYVPCMTNGITKAQKVMDDAVAQCAPDDAFDHAENGD